MLKVKVIFTQGRHQGMGQTGQLPPPPNFSFESEGNCPSMNLLPVIFSINLFDPSEKKPGDATVFTKIWCQ